MGHPEALTWDRGVVRWLRRLFGADDPGAIGRGESDPLAVVWVATVALWQAPLVVHELNDHGIDATFAESSSRRMLLGGGPAARIYVHQLHRAEAERIILDVTCTGRPEDGTYQADPPAR